MIEVKKLFKINKFLYFQPKKTHLLIRISKIGRQYIVQLNWSMKTFTWFSVVVPGDTLSNDVVEQVQEGMDFWKVPAL